MLLDWFRELGEHAETKKTVSRDVLLATQRARRLAAIGISQQVQRKIQWHSSRCLPHKFGVACASEDIGFGLVTYQDVNAGLQPYDSVDE